MLIKSTGRLTLWSACPIRSFPEILPINRDGQESSHGNSCNRTVSQVLLLFLVSGDGCSLRISRKVADPHLVRPIAPHGHQGRTPPPCTFPHQLNIGR